LPRRPDELEQARVKLNTSTAKPIMARASAIHVLWIARHVDQEGLVESSLE